MATWAQLSFQESGSPMMEQMINFHDHTMMILLMITMMVGYIMTSMIWNKQTNRNLLDGQMIETAWTILPVLILIAIALPSLRLLYLMDEISEPSITLKTIGHQWYWSYEYSDFNQVEFDSYMIPSNEMSKDMSRLLEVDNRTVLPMLTQVRVLVTAADVLHSWTVPSMGVKVDATPGRINQTSFLMSRPGLFYGQCSEICGANHSFMPISIESVSIKTFLEWIKKNAEN
uniref:Cytochrome c oxidase subunit 2 n=2 Tax=Atrocalopteryx atrata TaxID=193161 RepID=A0A0F7DHC4_9ODON|nr:cytochrome c oxidase subunit II [Atrocalopteryx atrata]AKH04379.1 cytochrome c oxidase subunit II [Atrocalopteryx atrata]